MFGLPSTTLTQIIDCIRGFPDIHWVKVYGSRAIGNYEKGSDIDLAFSSENNCAAELLAALESLPTPYLFDVTHYDSLKNANLKAHIDRVGVMLYTNRD